MSLAKLGEISAIYFQYICSPFLFLLCFEVSDDRVIDFLLQSHRSLRLVGIFHLLVYFLNVDCF